MLSEWQKTGAPAIHFATLTPDTSDPTHTTDPGETLADLIRLANKEQNRRPKSSVHRPPDDTGEIIFHLANGDAMHACLASGPKGATRLSLYSTNGNLMLLPIDSRCVHITTQTQFAKLEREIGARQL